MPSVPDSNLGFAPSTKGKLPVNALRHPLVDDTNGWYIWCGEDFSDETNFIAPLHTSHIYEGYPEIAKFLGLPPPLLAHRNSTTTIRLNFLQPNLNEAARAD
jgi:hypothetical protein